MNKKYNYLGHVELIDGIIQLPFEAFVKSGISIPCEMEIEYDLTKDVVLISQTGREKDNAKYHRKVSADDMIVEIPDAVERLFDKLNKTLDEAVFLIFTDADSHTICLKIVSVSNLFGKETPDNKLEFASFQEIPSEEIVFEFLEKLAADSAYSELKDTQDYLREQIVNEFDESTFEEYIAVQSAIRLLENKYMIRWC